MRYTLSLLQKNLKIAVTSDTFVQLPAHEMTRKQASLGKRKQSFKR